MLLSFTVSHLTWCSLAPTQMRDRHAGAWIQLQHAAAPACGRSRDESVSLHCLRDPRPKRLSARINWTDHSASATAPVFPRAHCLATSSPHWRPRWADRQAAWKRRHSSLKAFPLPCGPDVGLLGRHNVSTTTPGSLCCHCRSTGFLEQIPRSEKFRDEFKFCALPQLD